MKGSSITCPGVAVTCETCCHF